MNRFLLTTLYFLFSIIILQAQSLTGIWRGYFIQQSILGTSDRFKFEVQINHLSNNSLMGVTYSYKTTVFYAKASLQGIYTKKTKNVLIKEIKIIKVKISDQSEPCLMTCYLEFSKIGRLQTLTGSYTSVNINDKLDCGSGRVYLEKVTESDFKKEDFLIAKSKPSNNNTTSKYKPGAESDLVDKNKLEKKEVDKKVEPEDTKIEIEEKKEEPKKEFNLPTDVIKRENFVSKTLNLPAGKVKIEIYDNGEIDNDTVTVYHNKECIVNKNLLTTQPISFTFEISKEDPRHEFILFADNLGTIPPNTALMLIFAGGKRYELSLTSTKNQNAVVVISLKE